MANNRVLVVGSGQMGSGIALALTLAKSEIDVVLYDTFDESLARGMTYIDKTLRRDIEKKRVTEELAVQIKQRINAISLLTVDEGQVDFAIEAVSEDLSVKATIFQQLDKLCPAQTILASNTSSLSISAIAAVTQRPQNVIGLHFFNPVPVMPLIEIICGQLTSAETENRAHELAVKLNKTPIKIADYPGFIGNRLVIPMINEAIFALMEGVATAEDIDNVAKLGFNHPLGPLALSDLIGNDVVLHIMESLQQGFGDPKYRPCPLLRRMVQAGLLGKKTGKGFYNY